MTEDETKPLLKSYADGTLPVERMKEVDAVLESSLTLREELKSLRAEAKPAHDEGGITTETLLDDALISEALAPLHPSRSARIRLTEAMMNLHRQAEHAAKTLPEDKWRIIRLCFVFVTLLIATLLVYYYPRPITGGGADEKTLIAWADTGIFIMGLAFVLSGRVLVKLETLLVGMFSRREVKPTALEILTLEVFGMFCLIISGVIYWYTVVR